MTTNYSQNIMVSDTPSGIKNKYSKEEKQFFYHKLHLHNRRAKIKRVQQDTTSCPECTSETRYDENRAETYCTQCGLVVSAPIEYVGLRKVVYEYGRN